MKQGGSRKKINEWRVLSASASGGFKLLEARKLDFARTRTATVMINECPLIVTAAVVFVHRKGWR